MPKILLIDGFAVAYRAHFAMSRSGLTAPDGRSTAATYGYTSTLLKILRTEKPDYACVAFDTAEPTYRHELFEDYKADRPDMPDDLVDQLEWINGVTEGLGVRLIAIEGYEADDIIGTLVSKAGEAGMDAIVVTGDKDLLQLVNPKTRVMMLSGSGRDTRMLDKEAVVEKYGIPPDHLIDYFGLTGDAVDNIKGVPGIGPKTAGALVKEFGTLEQIYENLENIRPARVSKILSDNREAAFSSRDLVTVHREVPLPVGLEDLKLGCYKSPDLQDLFRELGFRTLARELVPDSPAEEVNPDVWQDAGTDPAGISCGRRMAIEINLDGTNAATSTVLGVAICCEGEGDHYFPIGHREPGNVSADTFGDVAGGLLADPSVPKVAHDTKRATVALQRLGIEPAGLDFDTLLAGYLLKPGQGGTSVEDLAALYLGRFMAVEKKGKAAEQLATIKQASEKCAVRSRTILEAVAPMEAELRAKELWSLFTKVEMPLALVLADMELRGAKISRSHLSHLSDDLDKRMSLAEKEAYALAGREFNMNSPRDVARVLFEEIGLKPRRKTKTGYSTDVSVLTELSAEHPLPGKILEYRQHSKLKTSHVDQLMRYADPETDRIHANFHQAVTSTGRLSSSEPNLQNVPIRGDLGGEIRKAFIPGEPGWVLVSADYSQIELRVVAHLSGDRALIEAFSKGEDIHSQTAAFVFKVEPDKVTRSMRTIAKAVNFGILYGMGAQALAKNTGLSREEASGFLKEHRQTYPGLYEYIDRCLEEARETGMVQTVLGRRRYIPDLSSGQSQMRSAAERMAINTPVQGSAADIIKLAMLEISKDIKRQKLRGGIIIQVHDEILVDCPESEREVFEAMLREKMRGAYDLQVPLKVEVQSGANWYEAH
ncbi:MAG: DNA polymerase I [bacterium]|jgi:DNA polymerase-1